MKAPPAISIRNVSKRFDDALAVSDVSLEVARGEFFSLLGPSGCGKTTLLRIIAGFESSSAGRIELEGSDISNVPPYRRNVNTVFQHYALFPHLNVFDNIAFGPRSRRQPRREIDQRVGDILR